MRKQLPNRRTAIFDVLLCEKLREPGIRFLELGVFQASNIKYAMEHYPNIVEYTGIDDYGASGDSPYVNPSSYWKSREDADRQFELSRQIFEDRGQRLHRMTSDEYFAQCRESEKYDIVFVDGNHKYKYALTDMVNYFEMVKNDGVLMVDDYGNSDTPEVTRAVMDFISEHFTSLAQVSWVRLPFVNVKKIVPTTLAIVAIRKRN